MPHKKQCVMCGKLFEPIAPGSRSMACSDGCYTDMKALIIKHHGAFKKCVDYNGVAHRVPTEDIIERSIQESDLTKYPRWDEPAKGSIP